MPEPAETSISQNESVDDSNNGESINLFTLSFINNNPEGWGPSNQPDQYKDLPYQKFSKSDAIGKVSYSLSSL